MQEMGGPCLSHILLWFDNKVLAFLVNTTVGSFALGWSESTPLTFALKIFPPIQTKSRMRSRLNDTWFLILHVYNCMALFKDWVKCHPNK